MSAPDTNIERQKSEHKPALLSIRAAVVFGALMLMAVIFTTVMQGQPPTEETMSGDPEERAEFKANVSTDPVEPGTNVSN